MNIKQAQLQLEQKRRNIAQDNKEKALTSIADILNRQNFKKTPQKPEDKAVHQRAYWVELTRQSLGKHWKTHKDYTFSHINGLTKSWSVEKIKNRYLYIKKYAKCEFSKAWFGMRKKDLAA